MKVRWGILATGGIARRFAESVAASESGELVAVGSRTAESAAAFCEKFGGRPHGSYEALLADPEVDAVYIATPHHLHMQNTLDAAAAGKAILCEKPFTLNALEAERALEGVRKAGVFFMEAFMYRCHPQTLEVKRLVRSGAIGQPLAMQAEFGFGAKRDWENFRTVAAVGGGALMDVGCYCVSMSRMVAGAEPESLQYFPTLSPAGYDAHGVGAVRFPDGFSSHFGTSIHVPMRNDVTIYGEEGSIRIEAPWFCKGAVELHRRGQDPENLTFETERPVWSYEVDAVAEFLQAGVCPHMTPEDTLGNMRALDALRASCGLQFAAETTS